MFTADPNSRTWLHFSDTFSDYIYSVVPGLHSSAVPTIMFQMSVDFLSNAPPIVLLYCFIFLFIIAFIFSLLTECAFTLIWNYPTLRPCFLLYGIHFILEDSLSHLVPSRVHCSVSPGNGRCPGTSLCALSSRISVIGSHDCLLTWLPSPIFSLSLPPALSSFVHIIRNGDWQAKFLHAWKDLYFPLKYE